MSPFFVSNLTEIVKYKHVNSLKSVTCILFLRFVSCHKLPHICNANSLIKPRDFEI